MTENKKFTQKERLLSVLRKNKADRPPVICTGGMMNAAIIDIMKESGHTLPQAHSDPEKMALLAEDIHEHTGFENFGLPFCMTVEAELLGSQTDLGTLECEPKITRERFESAEKVKFGNIDEMVNSGRMRVVAEAAHIIAARNPDIPVIASLTGPVSTAASVIDPLTFYKGLRKNQEASFSVLDYITELLINFAQKCVRDNGASVIAAGDPSATGEILGPLMFERFALKYLNKLADAVHEMGVPFIVHICGDLSSVRHLLPELHCDALSTDAVVNLSELRKSYPSITTMGNVSTFSLEWNETDKIRNITRGLVRSGVDIISPACGLSTSTKIKTIQAMTDEVKKGLD